jgi:hypothetical protein
VAVANDGTGRVMTSDNGGETWTLRTGDARAWTGVCWSPERHLFVAVGANGVMTSPDGVIWTARTAANGNNWFNVLWARKWGLFVANSATGAGTDIMTSPDGITWTARATATGSGWVRAAYSDALGRVVVVRNGIAPNIMTSDDGVRFTTRSGPTNPMLGVCRYEEVGLFVAVHNVSVELSTSPDGETWTTVAAAAGQTWQNACAAPELGLVCAVAIAGTNGVMTSVSAHSFPYRS